MFYIILARISEQRKLVNLKKVVPVNKQQDMAGGTQ